MYFFSIFLSTIKKKLWYWLIHIMMIKTPLSIKSHSHQVTQGVISMCCAVLKVVRVSVSWPVSYTSFDLAISFRIDMLDSWSCTQPSNCWKNVLCTHCQFMTCLLYKHEYTKYINLLNEKVKRKKKIFSTKNVIVQPYV